MANSRHRRHRPPIILLLLAVIATACAQGGGQGAEAPPETAGEATSADTPAGDEGSDAATAEADTSPLHLGYILPETGALAFLGPGTIGAVNVAVDEINDAGGVLGNPVELSPGDEGDSDGVVANQSADRLIESQDVDAIIGTLSTAVMLTVIDKITSSGTVECAPAGTSPVFTDYPDNGYHFRTAASDLLLAPVFANVMAGDGNVRIAHISRADDSGRNLMRNTREQVLEIGAESVAEVYYDPTTRSFDATVSEVAAAQPDAVMIFAFDEGAALLQRMIEGGLGPDDVNIYVHSGLRSTELPGRVDPADSGVLDGVKGVSPAATQDEGFLERLRAEAPDLSTVLFAGEAYDCTMLTALAAEQAGSTAPEAIRDQMIAVTRDGTECSGFAECRDLIAAGEDIDYAGVSGPLDFIDAGEPSVGTYDVWGWNAIGELETMDTIRTDELG